MSFDRMLTTSIDDIATLVEARGGDFGASCSRDTQVIAGLRRTQGVAQGMALRVSDATVLRRVETWALCPAGAVLHVTFAGAPRATMNGVPLAMERRAGGPVRLVVVANDHSATLHRVLRPGEAMCKIALAVGPDWLAARGLDLAALPRRAGVAQGAWTATGDEIAAADLLRSPGAQGDAARALGAEAAALRLWAGVARRLAQAGGATETPGGDKLARMEQAGLRPGPMPSPAEIARAGGVSLSTMRRLFLGAHRQAPAAYLRLRRLERARAELAAGARVADAAWRAGYARPTAFATAFRAAFGQSPSAAR
ncbi:helix-turn-helix domain-containing protein [Mesobaculum littorinae]|uniref:Helix-turn-helix domain-containing protein n=1 Tax=Mesobaculum littorinae TaxID=2486419 RepID=A0A438AJ89_9RHOB|nr:helix-turn-helix domain-containing protein [Mesobaculum littorinae]RVV98843.1 helix-turn-helix domain-containing protein [Mesobaculum littorinae]